MPIGLRRARLPLHFLLAAESRRGGRKPQSQPESEREGASRELPARRVLQPAPCPGKPAPRARPFPTRPDSVPPSPGECPDRLGEGGDGGVGATALRCASSRARAAPRCPALPPALPRALRSAPGRACHLRRAGGPGGMLGAFLVAWLLGALAAGVPGPPCQAPQQWEGRQVRYDHSSGRNTRALLSYDGLQQRVRLLEEKKALIPCKKFFEYIFLYQDAVMFQIDQATKLCSKIALTDQWDPLDIPQNSTYEDQYYIGGPQDQIMVQEWSDRKPARKFETWVGIYTVKDCYPVQETYTRNYSVTFSTRFFDIQLGIHDPSVFTPPSTCERAQTRMMSDAC
ncbi:mammalian ependymin-related protein 1 [Sminthopsis crassicaudata]|uniref:mammalian ependymin-related protein 1 n=1 Tax=Sminthopsis crassicaudata TaxID=9301 RepID=UPI003D690CAD